MKNAISPVGGSIPLGVMHAASDTYRPEIDGLRAVAVVPVIFFHMGVAGFGGGYVGVDIFFVISGFLITKILHRNILLGNFSILGFYQNRIRRIFPALISMLTFSLVVATFVLMPRDLKDYGQSLVASASSFSNVYFFAKANYFDSAAELKPLLHTWSLSVEEQFYFIFPLFLFCLRNASFRWRLGAIVGLATISFLLSVYQVETSPAAAFYLPFSRAWELLLGALGALFLDQSKKGAFREWLSIFGLSAILLAVVNYDRATPFPGAAALLPCLGTLLILSTGPETSVGRLLALPPLRFVGLISYSLYLWHWPVLSFARYYYFGTLDLLQLAGCLITTIGLSVFSWRYIELPFRSRRHNFNRNILFGFAGGAALSLSFVGLLYHLSNGFPQRLPAQVRTFSAAAFDINPDRARCDHRSASSIQREDLCRIGARGGRETFVVLGDSFADALVPSIDIAASKLGISGLVLTSAGCYPLVGIRQEATDCSTFTDAAFKLIMGRTDISSVVLIGRWTSAVEGTRFGENAVDRLFITDQYSAHPGYEENVLTFRRGWDRTLALLKGRRVLTVAFLPEQPFNVPRRLALESYRDLPLSKGVDVSTYNQRQARTRQELVKLSLHDEMKIVDAGRVLCDSSNCPVFESGTVLYYDDNHMSRTGAINKLTATFFDALQ